VIARIEHCLHEALEVLKREGVVPNEMNPAIKVMHSPNADNGHLATNLALLLAESSERAARDIATSLVNVMSLCPGVLKVDIAGPGFINFFIAKDAQTAIVTEILSLGLRFGRSNFGAGKRLQAGFFCATNHAQLNVWHGRVAALWSSLANMFEATGFDVYRQCYANAATAPNNVAEDLARLGIQYDQFNDPNKLGLLAASQVDPITGRLAPGTHECIQDSAAWFSYESGKRQHLQVQSVGLRRSARPMQILPRSSSQLTLRQLYEEVGKDAARYFYIKRKCSRHLEFDLELATRFSCENPMYSAQLACARISSFRRQIRQRGSGFNRAAGLAALSRLTATAETGLMMQLAFYPDVLQRAVIAHEPHQLTGYLRDLANGLHTYYRSKKLFDGDHQTTQARLCLLLAVQQVLKNGLVIIGVSTPEVL
jgi:arginyl-tRNA synthetase